LVLSFMSGIVHTYYTVAMAPAVAALVGMGAVDLWAMHRSPATRWALPLGIGATGAWAYVLLDRSPAFLPWLRWLLLLGSIAAAAVLLLGPSRLPRRVAAGAAVLAAVVVLAGPSAYAIDTLGRSNAGGTPSAGPALTAGGGLRVFGTPPGGASRGAAGTS